MKKSELRKIIKEEIQKLNELVNLYYNEEGKLKKLKDIEDLEGAIDYYKDVLIYGEKRRLPKNANYSDKRQLFDYQDGLKDLKDELKKRNRKK